MLTGQSDPVDRVVLELGADDDFTKPFNTAKAARIKAVLRRVKAHGPAPVVEEKAKVYRFAGWELNLALRR
ncbi:MAG: hypothetical protein U1F68_00185 [Gammaproteobacteria bacterium]